MEQISPANNSRNYGIDLLRVLLSIMVIILHLLLYGGVQDAAVPFTMSYQLLWLLGFAADCAVNCFALISGFVSYGRKLWLTNLLRMHLTVVFYGIVITWSTLFFMPQAVNFNDRLRALFPVTMGTYWYYTFYVILFFLTPLLNGAMKRLSKAQANGVIILMGVLFSLVPSLTGKDFFSINNGFSLPWLALLYFIGAYLKKYYDDLCHRKAALLMTYLGCTGITWGLKFLLEAWSATTRGEIMDTSALVSYSFPTILFSAIALVLLFSTLEVPAWKMKALSILAPLSFSVYIIHEQPLIRQLVIFHSLLFVTELPALMQPVIVILAAVLIWLVCSGLDWLRQRLFVYLHIEQLLRRLDGKPQPCKK